MKGILIVSIVLLQGLAGCAATSVRAADARTTATSTEEWDAARVARSIDAARQAREQGDLPAAERACYAAFEAVDRSALAALDAYADLVEAEHRPDASKVRAQAVQLREIKASQAGGKEPTSTYLGFAPTDVLKAYAEALDARDRRDEAQRVRSLAVAYQQVQQAHFQRTTLYRQGRDPRGTC